MPFIPGIETTVLMIALMLICLCWAFIALIPLGIILALVEKRPAALLVSVAGFVCFYLVFNFVDEPFRAGVQAFFYAFLDG
jgi:hypothetical protein